MEPLKILRLDTWAEPSRTKPFFRFRRPRIGFVRKYETFVVFYEKIYKPLEFGTEPDSLP